MQAIGLISAILKDTLMEFRSSIKCFLSSPPTIIITINLMILLILVSSALHRRRDAHLQHPETTSNYLLDHVDIDLEFQTAHDLDQPPSFLESLPRPPLPTPSAPPIWDFVEIPSLPPPPPSNVVQVEAPPVPIRNNTTTSTSWYDDVSSAQEYVGKDTSTAVATIEKWKDVCIENEEEKEATDQENLEEDNTMDATWEAIIGGGKPKPKKKPLKKSETWDAPPQRQRQRQRQRKPRRLDSEEVVPTSPKWRELRKAETFNDAVSLTRRGGLVRRDPSMSLEEFNQKVERFIKNFNDGIRLQRQESYRRFMDIINQKRR